MSGKILIIIGIVLIVIGIITNYQPWFNWLGLINWFGKLPGDINIKKDNSQIFIPITSMLLISGIISLISNLFFKR